MMKVTQAQMLKIMGKEMIIVVSDLGRLSHLQNLGKFWRSIFTEE